MYISDLSTFQPRKQVLNGHCGHILHHEVTWGFATSNYTHIPGCDVQTKISRHSVVIWPLHLMYLVIYIHKCKGKRAF